MNELTPEQVTAITDVIRNDATCTGRLFNGNGGACVLGGLYAAKHDIDITTINTTRATELNLLSYEMIGKEWGLNSVQVCALWSTNDGFRFNLAERRERLIALVELWAE